MGRKPPTIRETLAAALAHHQGGRLPEAEAGYRRVIELDPGQADAWHYLGLIARDSGHLTAAADLIRKAAELRPRDAQVQASLGAVEYQLGHLDAAAAAFRRAIANDPRFALAHSNLGTILQELGRLDEAVAVGRDAIRLQPDFAEAHSNLGVSLLTLRRHPEAIAAFERALQLDPRNVAALNGLGSARRAAGDLDGAAAAWEAVLRLQPGFADAWNNLGIAQKDRGELDAAVASFRRVVAMAPNHPRAYHNLLLTLHYQAEATPDQLAAEHRRWNAQQAAPLLGSQPAPATTRDPERPLRIGYVSADFREHATARFLLPLLREHDRTRHELFCYANLPAGDDVTRQYQSLVPAWRQVAGRPDAEVADTIRADRIDILVDLSAHTLGTRLLVFARRPAPVQVTWLAYAGGTGLAAMDYRLSDPFLDPPETPPPGPERCLRLPETFWCYEPAPLALDPQAQPSTPHAGITFGCLNNFCKVTPFILGVWAQILHRVAGSRLVLHAPEGSARARVLDCLARQGIAPGRVVFHPKQPLPQYFATYREIDVALDPYPFGGGTTTCDALWMGVPVVTLCGPTPVGRAGTSLLSNTGLPELVARTPDDYVRIACTLAADAPRLSALKATLRGRLERSPLMDAPRFARNVESAYREMWRQWCATSPTFGG